MTYIWNRVNRVPQRLMPQRVERIFRTWEREQWREYDNATSESKRKNIVHRINRQLASYQNAVAKYAQEAI